VVGDHNLADEPAKGLPVESKPPAEPKKAIAPA
jgi:hypothetical protein